MNSVDATSTSTDVTTSAPLMNISMARPMLIMLILILNPCYLVKLAKQLVESLHQAVGKQVFRLGNEVYDVSITDAHINVYLH